MVVAGNQPYFFPYLGYFSLLANADYFAYGDTLQYMRHSWVNRNRIIASNGKISYITVPVKKMHFTNSIGNTLIDYSQGWQNKILCQLDYYKKRAPYYKETISILGKLFSKEYANIADLNIASCSLVMEYLGLKENPVKMSETKIDLSSHTAPDEVGIIVTQYFKGNEYWNPQGGVTFYDKSKYLDAGIDIKFIQNNLKEYDQSLDHFEPGLSIIDVLMFNSPEKVVKMISDFHFV